LQKCLERSGTGEQKQWSDCDDNGDFGDRFRDQRRKKPIDQI
jgi:hypothetical protein